MKETDFWVRPEDIPLELNLLRYADGNPVDYQLRVYTLTGLNTNFARPCFAIAPRGDADMDDISGVLEETLSRITENGIPTEDVYRIMGLVKASELSTEELDEGEHLDVDMGFVTAGFLESYETVPDEVARATNVITDRQLSHFERAMEKGLSFKQAMRLTEHDFSGFQADMAMEALSAGLSEKDLDAICDGTRSPYEMRVLTDIAKDYDDISPYLAMHDGQSIALTHAINKRLDEWDAEIPVELLTPLSRDQLAAINGVVLEHGFYRAGWENRPLAMLPYLIEPANTPEVIVAIDALYQSHAAVNEDMMKGLLCATSPIDGSPVYDSDQKLTLLREMRLNPGLFQMDKDHFFTVFDPGVDAARMGILAGAIRREPGDGERYVGTSEILAYDRPELSNEQLSVILHAAADADVPEVVPQALSTHPELSTAHMHKVIAYSKMNFDKVVTNERELPTFIAQMHVPAKDARESAYDLAHEGHDVASAKDTLARDAHMAPATARNQEEK